MTHVVGLSGGKDSTCMALRLMEVEPRVYVFLTTPTGDELPEMVAHWERLEKLLVTPLTRVTNGTLAERIAHYRSLPSFRIRYCTRELKIEPTLRFLAANAPATLYVGLRADEEERRGLYHRDVPMRFPLREWGWGEREVRAYLREKGVRIPARTDCARCYGQRLSEWKRLWEKHPAIYADAEAMEEAIGHTFRSPARDTKPAALKGLRVLWEQQPALPLDPRDDEDEEQRFGACRLCRL